MLASRLLAMDSVVLVPYQRVLGGVVFVPFQFLDLGLLRRYVDNALMAGKKVIKLNLVFAYDKNYGIGYRGGLPWPAIQ